MHTGRFGAVGVGLAAAVLLLAGGAIWVARHPWRDMSHSLDRIPAVSRFRRWYTTHFGELTAELLDRLGRRGVAAAALLAGLLGVMVLAVGFTALLDDALEGDGVAQIDRPAASWLATHREGWLNTSLTVLTHLGDPAAQTIWLTVVCAVAAWRARSWLPVILGAVGGIGIAVVLVTAKAVVGRQRPDPPFALVASHGYSFPSGHAAGAAAVGLLSAWMLCRWVVHSWAGQVAVWALSIAFVGVVGFSRLYLGVHFVTDVLAGWLLGTGWAATVALVAAWWSGPDRPRIGARSHGSGSI